MLIPDEHMAVIRKALECATDTATMGESAQEALDAITALDERVAVSDTAYYIVGIDDNGDVFAIEASLVARGGLAIVVRSSADGTVAFENQGDDWESARDALAAVMPTDDEFVEGE